MAATFLWQLQGGTPTEIAFGDNDVLQFAGAAFNEPIFVGEYNDTTHVKDGNDDSDKSSGNTPNNNKFISQTGGTGGDSQADWGDGTEDLDQITTAEAALKINISDVSAFEVVNAVLYAYNGSNTAVAPVGVDVRVAEVGDANFTQAEGSASALALDDQTSNTSHDYFIVASIAPTAVGLKPGKLRMEAVLQ